MKIKIIKERNDFSGFVFVVVTMTMQHKCTQCIDCEGLHVFGGTNAVVSFLQVNELLAGNGFQGIFLKKIWKFWLKLISNENKKTFSILKITKELKNTS